MAYLGQFYLSEQLLGEKILPDPPRKISRNRIPLGSTVRKSLLGRSFPKPHTIPPWGGTKIQTWPKEVTHQMSNGAQQRKRYSVPTPPLGAPWDAIQANFRAANITWRALSSEQKETLDDRARHHNTMSGYNLHIREYIRANY